MPRATFIIARDRSDEIAAAEELFDRWQSALTYVSDNNDCGCCVDIFHVEGPAEAIVAVPAEVSVQSEWTYPPTPPVT